MGNSEVGHLNLGAGSVVKQDLARIDDAIADGTFFENEVLLAACERARVEPAGAAAPARARLRRRACTPAGSTSRPCIELAAREGVPDLVLHAFTDGRDTQPDRRRRLHRGGRALAAQRRPDRHRQRPLLRDGSRPRWERTKLAYDALVHAEGLRAASAAEAIADALRARRHRRVRRADRDRRLRRHAADGDVVVALQLPARPDAPDRRGARRSAASTSFERGGGPGVDLTTMASYRAEWEFPVAFPPTAPGDDDRRGDQRVRAAASSTSPRPRSTRTSPTSSTADARRSGRGRSAASSTRLATSPPTTTSPR